MEMTRKETFERLVYENKMAQKFTEKAKQQVKKGKRGKAIDFLDLAKTVNQCALQTHDQFWKVSNGDMTTEEYAEYYQAEVIFKGIREAYIDMLI